MSWGFKGVKPLGGAGRAAPTVKTPPRPSPKGEGKEI